MKLGDFQEIAHCGMKFTVGVQTTPQGKQYQLGIQGSSPNAASIIGIYALPNGIPAGVIKMGGIGQAFNKPPYPGCYTIFVGSDSQGKFGHECQKCSNYWRSAGATVLWPLTCPYCGNRDEGHQFLTNGQVQYIQACCELINKAMAELEDGERAIEMDKVADSIDKNNPKPKFYYSEVSQQKRFNCTSCGTFNDILGRFGYCSACGTYNGLDEFNEDLDRLASRISSQEYEACVRDAVAVFDSFARNIVKQLVNKIPMTPARKNALERKKFHSLVASTELLEKCFDINLLKGMKVDDIKFVTLMFHRRHIYEHNGGEVDAKYLSDSGDPSVRLKQTIKESSESAQRTIALIKKIALNLHTGFHLILPPEQKPIDLHTQDLERIKSRKR